MTARFRMCRTKGFDAVEPDNLDGWENRTGFPLTAREQLVYDEWVARTVHSLGMAVFQKGDPEQAAKLEPYFDGALDEQCATSIASAIGSLRTCALISPRSTPSTGERCIPDSARATTRGGSWERSTTQR